MAFTIGRMPAIVAACEAHQRHLQGNGSHLARNTATTAPGKIMKQAREPRGPNGRNMAADYRLHRAKLGRSRGFSPLLFWRQRNGAVFGFIRDGELFDAKWVYVCDSNKATHFAEVIAPEEHR